MKQRVARPFVIARLVLLAVAALCVLPPHTRAQQTTESLVVFPSVGLAPGEAVRFTLFNPEGTPVRAQAQVHHSGGVIVGLGDGSVRLGEFQSFDLKRGDISAPGEPGTGRLQLRGSFQLVMTEPRQGSLAVSMETYLISDGTSNTMMVGKRPPSAAGGSGRDVLIGGSGRDILLGIVPGQTLRVTLLNPPSADSDPRSTGVGGHVRVFDGSGALLARTDDVFMPAGTFRSFDFDRDALAVPGDADTDRLQLRIQPVLWSVARRDARGLVSFEVVDNRTGATTVLEGHQALVFYLGGIPNDE